MSARSGRYRAIRDRSLPSDPRSFVTERSAIVRYRAILLGIAAVGAALVACGCASTNRSTTDFDGARDGSTGGNGSVGPAGNSGASGSSGVANLGGGESFGDGAAPSLSATTGGGAMDAGGITQVCTDGGCTCIRIASIGHEGVWGACGMNSDGTGAFETWLNTQSTATVDSYANAKPTLTPSFLAPYNVIVLQWLRDVPDAGGEGALWEFTQDEVNALADWVKAGGGLISMSGYDGDGNEVAPLNALLSFTDFSYDMDGTYGSSYAGGSCWGGASALTGWNTGSPIGAHLTEVGIDNGRSISVDADAGYGPVLDCACPGGNACAAHEDIGNGHVFAFTDEWVTYTSQWLGAASCIPASCTGNTPADDFQVPQFWYNAIRYASESAKCVFTINNPMIVPR